MDWEDVIRAKIVEDPGLLRSRLDESASGKVVVLTKGVYDLFHVGHLKSFLAARRLGEVLVVGVNADRAVRMRKGSSRPIMDQGSRAFLIASLPFVDWVTIYEDVSPGDLIQAVRPHVFAVSHFESLRPSERESLGNVRLIEIPKVEGGISTTRIIERINELGSDADEAE